MDKLTNFRIGIDFGTTFSFVGFYRNENVMSLVPVDCNYGVPSVFFDNGKENGKLFGKYAEKKLGKKDGKYVVASIKRKISETGVILDSGKKKYKVEDIVYELINDLVINAIRTAQENYQLDFDKNCNYEAVITVPVDFTEPQRTLIRTAASRIIIPGTNKHLNILRTLPEPVAASMEYFGVRSKEDSDILVLDLGGGTFDVAWVKSNSKNQKTPYEVIDQDGDKQLGGNDWDKVIADFLVSKYEKEYSEEVSDYDYVYVLREARQIKEELTKNEYSDFTVELHGNEIDGTITRQEFEKMTHQFVERYLAKIDEVVKRQNEKNLGHVILTGGSSYMPMIENAVRNRFKDKDVRTVDPAHAIANGAARYAADLESDKDAGKIQLISSHAYGIRYFYESEKAPRIRILVPKGVKLPYSGSAKSYTRWDNWTSTRYAVYESNSSEPKDTRISVDDGVEILSVEMKYNPPVPKDSETTDTLTISLDEVLSITSVSEKYNLKTEGEISLIERHMKG